MALALHLFHGQLINLHHRLQVVGDRKPSVPMGGHEEAKRTATVGYLQKYLKNGKIHQHWSSCESKEQGILQEKPFQKTGCVVWWGQMREKYYDKQAQPSNRADYNMMYGWRIELFQYKYHLSLFSKLNQFSIAEICNLWIKEVLQKCSLTMNVGSLWSWFGPQLYSTVLQMAVIFSKGGTDHDIILKWK